MPNSPHNAAPQAREEWMDLFKGFAIIIVVLVHVLRGLTLANLGQEYRSVFLYIDYTVLTFLMPMFFLISGALYTKEKKLTALSDYKALFIKKFIRLGIPYLIFSFLQGLLRLALNGQTNVAFSPKTLLLIPLVPFDHFWFLYALLLIFWIVPLMEFFIKDERIILLLLLAANVISTALDNQLPIGFFFVYGFYFYVGAILYRHAKHWLSNIPFLLSMSVLYLIMNLACHGLDKNPTVLTTIFLFVIMAIAGSLTSLLISQFVLNKNPISKKFFTLLGHYSFEIYLLHSLFTSASRIFLVKAHIYTTEIHIAVGLLLGLIIPILIVMTSKNIPFMDFAFYPAKYLDAKKKAKPGVAIPAT